ncbi:DsbA family protein [Streptomyces sp. AK02-01A]|uniref:DsbA family protein n=1 Tax=Streptomyces sp. AK02-01A TaxID=3028648 RepID=UPI0029B8F6F5|nr:DsbA family protein [Streptomyces sp. AK02-01A]MDX3852848.1 DsbA family protein [Streptomyces sp. AK02-01A]
MSARNNQTSKAAARERLREERERQAKKDKVRRQLVVIGSAVVVLAIAGGVGFAVVQNNKPSHWEAMKDETNVVAPKNTEGTDGTTVVLGKADAKKTLELYEDSRCPICASFEQTVGPTVLNDIDAGKYKVKYVGATFIDNSDNGTGSKNALSALGAALNVSPDAFLQYKTALYSTKYHPEESTDKFADDSYLIKVADSVNSLKGNKAFQRDVRDGTYDAWAMKMSAAFDKSGVQGTPTFKMDGKTLTAEGSQNPPMTVAEFNAAITKALAA